MKLAAPIIAFTGALALAVPAALQAQAAPPPSYKPLTGPKSWVDAKTGHRIVRLSDAPGNYALYFNYNPYTPQGDKMVFSTAEGISVVDLKDWAVKPLVKAKIERLLFTGRKTRTAYYTVRTGGTARGADADGQRGMLQLWAADIDTGRTRKVVDLPAGQIDTINADETLVAGQVASRAMALQPGATPGARNTAIGQAEYAANGPDGKPLTFAEAKEVRLNDRLEARIPMEMFTVDLKTGERRVVHRATDWLNHLQFSTTDPGLLMFCHEGPWHKVDRIWTIRTDAAGAAPVKVHERTMNMEIAGHEWWSPDGKTIWYDLQTPRGEKFWVAGYDVDTKKRRWYHLERDQWSVHFQTSTDGKTFAGDGGDSEMVAHAKDGKWIWLLKPQAIPDVAGIHADNADRLIAPGRLIPEQLVDMSRHDYRLEPNIHFTPDDKWLVFRSNMEGSPAIYAVEIAKAK